MEFRPRLETIEMVKETIEKHDREYSVYQLWKMLPRKMKYQTYKNVLSFLIKNKDIVTDSNKKISLIWHPKEEMKAIDKEDILFNLSKYGYELISPKPISKKNTIPLEDLIIDIIIKFPDARFIEAIPILLIKNKINTFELYRKAFDFGLINKIGYLLEIALIIAKKFKRKMPDLIALASAFEQKKDKQIQYFSALKDKLFLEKFTPELMKKWNLRGRFMLEDFIKEEYL